MHWFLRGLLNEWGLELQHLNLTGVLLIIGFTTVCEAFLGCNTLKFAYFKIKLK